MTTHEHDWFVYLLRCRDGSLYCGVTNNVANRLKEHNAGRGAKYTRSRLPVSLAYVESVMDKSSALRAEAKIKKMTRKAKEMLVQTREKP
jgi:putative endonuclease